MSYFISVARHKAKAALIGFVWPSCRAAEKETCDICFSFADERFYSFFSFLFFFLPPPTKIDIPEPYSRKRLEFFKIHSPLNFNGHEQCVYQNCTSQNRHTEKQFLFYFLSNSA